MTRTVNMHEAKTNLSKLIEAVENGDEIIIARDGKPAARITQLAPEIERNWSPALLAYFQEALDNPKLEPIPEFLSRDDLDLERDERDLFPDF
jgi:prevent-host-death family protein